MKVQESFNLFPFPPAEPDKSADPAASKRLALFQTVDQLNPAIQKHSVDPPLIDWESLFGFGTGSSPAPPPGPSGHLPPTGPNGDTMPFYDQGNSKACATTSLSMILKYLGIDIPPDVIDRAIRRTDNGTNLGDIIEFARDHGVEAEGYNNGTWEDLKSQIDQGHPVAVDMANSSGGRHMVVITGYYTDADGKEYVQYHDPELGDVGGVPGQEQTMSVERFKEKWGENSWGQKNFYIAFAPEGTDLPPGNDDGAEGVLGVTAGGSNIANGFDRIFDPDSFGSFVHGFPQFFGGLVQGAFCGLGTLLQGGSDWLGGAVEGIPVLENIVQPFTDLVNGFGACLSDVFNGFGEACDEIGGAFESLFEGDFGGFCDGIGDAVGDAVGGVVDAVGDAVDAVGDAIGDFFSGW
jgi:hypothetical protein